MKYSWLSPRDQRHNNWILYTEGDNGVALRDPYLELQCTKCGKVDELTAVERGLDENVTITSKSDYLISDDGFICVSDRFRSLLAEECISNVTFIPITDSPTHYLMLPDAFASATEASSGMEFLRPCPMCGRYRETCLFPMLQSFETGNDPLRLLVPSIAIEGVRGRKFWFCASQQIVAALKAHKPKGLEFFEAY